MALSRREILRACHCVDAASDDRSELARTDPESDKRAVDLVSAERLAAMGVESAWAFGYSPARPAGTYPGSTFGMLGGNGSASFADIDSGTAVAVMRNRCRTGDFTAATRVDHLVIDAPDQQGAGDE